MVISTAIKDGVNPDLALYVAKKESNLIATSTGDISIFKKGKPIYSRGIFQISKYYHPEITDEEAYDPLFNIEWAMPFLKNKKLCMNTFTTCYDYYEN